MCDEIHFPDGTEVDQIDGTCLCNVTQERIWEAIFKMAHKGKWLPVNIDQRFVVERTPFGYDVKVEAVPGLYTKDGQRLHTVDPLEFIAHRERYPMHVIYKPGCEPDEEEAGGPSPVQSLRTQPGDEDLSGAAATVPAAATPAPVGPPPPGVGGSLSGYIAWRDKEMAKRREKHE